MTEWFVPGTNNSVSAIMVSGKMSIYRLPSRRSAVHLALIAVIILVWLAIRSGYWETGWLRPETPALTSFEQAWRNRQSDVWVEVEGEVEKLLSDDLEGPRHQRFVIRLSSGLTLLIAHNIDLAQRVPVEMNDQVRVRGQYEWNKRGGLIHWTHHDPKGKLQGGWISLHNEEYR